MDRGITPIAQICDAAKKHCASLTYLDEAHAVGMYSSALWWNCGIMSRIECTLGKAYGVVGDITPDRTSLAISFVRSRLVLSSQPLFSQPLLWVPVPQSTT